VAGAYVAGPFTGSDLKAVIRLCNAVAIREVSISVAPLCGELLTTLAILLRSANLQLSLGACQWARCTMEEPSTSGNGVMRGCSPCVKC